MSDKMMTEEKLMVNILVDFFNIFTLVNTWTNNSVYILPMVAID